MAKKGNKKGMSTAVLNLGGAQVEVSVSDSDPVADDSGAKEATVEVPEVEKLDLKAKRELDAPRRYIFSRELFGELRERKMFYDLSMAELTELSDRLGGRQFKADEIIGRVVWDDGEPSICVRSKEKFQPHASLLIDRYAVGEGFVKLSSQLSVLDGGELTAEDLELLSVKRTGKLDGQLVELGAYCVRYSPKKGRWVVLGPLSGTQFFTDRNTGRIYPNKFGCLGEVRYNLGLESLGKDFPKLRMAVEEELAERLGRDAVAELGEAFTEMVFTEFVRQVKATHGQHVRLANTYSKAQAEKFVEAMNAPILQRGEREKAKKATPAVSRSPAERKLQEEERVRKTRNWLEEMEID